MQAVTVGNSGGEGALMLSTQVLVIGSGFAGATVAHKLLESGAQVTMLERGYWQKTIPTQSMGIHEAKSLPKGVGVATMLRSVVHPKLPKGQVKLSNKGILEFAALSSANMMCASAVGGGSHVYGGLLERSPNPNYWDQVHPALSEEKMQPHENYVCTLLKPTQPRNDFDIPNFPAKTLREDAIFDACEDDQPGMGILFPESRSDAIDYGVQREASSYHGDSVFGSYKGSKISVDFALLKKSLELGLKLLSGCEVEAIHRSENRYLVSFKQIATGNKHYIKADKVVLAAGALNTVKLLFKSQPHLNAMSGLGKGFGTNGDYAAYWRCQEKDKDYSLGTPCHGRVRVKGLDNAPNMVLANIGLPIPKSPLLPGFVTKPLQGTKRDLMVIGMGADAGDGCYRYQKKRLDLHYDASNSPIFDSIRTAFDLIATTSGKPVYYANKPTTVHQYGGARLASSDASGVVNEQGEVYSNPDLYVADAAALAQGVGGPPSITVCTWAAHVADGIGKDLMGQSDSYQHHKQTNIPEKNIKGFNFGQLDTLFASLPVACSEDPMGEFAGKLVMVRGLNWLPKILRTFIIKTLEPALFRDWYGKYLAAGKGHNIFKKGDKKKTELPFMFTRKVSSDGCSIVHQLNYDIPENSSKVKPILGEAKRLNKDTYLARMYYKKTKLVYYLLSAG